MKDIQTDNLLLMHGDCIERMADIADGHIDLTVTSPPYDNLRTYKDSLAWNEDIWKAIIKELYRVTKQGGVLVWVVGDAVHKGSETGTSFKQALYAMECGFRLHDTMIYQKNALPKNHNRYEQDFEYMFVLSKGKPNTFNPIRIPTKYPEKDTARQNSYYSKTDEINRSARSGKKRKPVGTDKIKGNIWNIPVGKGHSTLDAIAFKHPAIFPEKLAVDHIMSWTNRGDVVFDPFTGSGTTGKMALMNDRTFIGIEKVDEFFLIAAERTKDIFYIEDEPTQPNVPDDTEGTPSFFRTEDLLEF